MTTKTVKIRDAQADVAIVVGGVSTTVTPNASGDVNHVITQPVTVGQIVSVTDGITDLTVTIPFADVPLSLVAQRNSTSILITGTANGVTTITSPGGATQQVTPNADGEVSQGITAGFATDGASLSLADAVNTGTAIVQADAGGGGSTNNGAGDGAQYAPVTNLSVAYEGTGEFGVTWTPPADLSSLTEYSVTLDGVFDRTRTSDKDAYARAGLANGTTYTVGITAVYAGGRSAEVTLQATTNP